MGLAHFFVKLRNLAISAGFGPDSVSSEAKKLLSNGTVTGKTKGLRKRLDLPLEIMNGVDDLNKILKKEPKMDVNT